MELVNLWGLSFDEVLHLMEFVKLWIYRIVECVSLWSLLNIEFRKLRSLSFMYFMYSWRLEFLWSVLVMDSSIYEASQFMHFVIFVFDKFLNVDRSWDLSIHWVCYFIEIVIFANSHKFKECFNPWNLSNDEFSKFMEFVKISKMAKCEVGMFKEILNWRNLWAKCKVTEFANLRGLPFDGVYIFWSCFQIMDLSNYGAY